MKTQLALAILFLSTTALAQDDTGLKARELFYVKPAPATPAKPALKTVPATKPKGPTTSAVAVHPPSVSETRAADTAVAAPERARQSQSPDRETHMVQVGYSSTPLALKYSILRKTGDTWDEVDPDTEFRTGDRIRVRVESNSQAYLYIVMKGSSGKWAVLFPSTDIDGGNNRIERGRACTIPPVNAPAFYFDETAGTEKVSLVLSRTPEADLEKLIYAAGDRQKNSDAPAAEPKGKMIMASRTEIDSSVFGQVHDQILARDLVFEKVDAPTPEGKQEKAVYVATPDRGPNARLFVDLSLIHK